jgi:hypothetical protein
MTEKCHHRYSSGPLFRGHLLGGVSLGRCKNDAMEGFTVCHEHVTLDALLSMIGRLRNEIKTLRSKP